MTRTLALALMSVLNIASTLAFQWVVLTMIGPGRETDALFAAMTLPQIFASVISASLANVLTPILAGETDDVQRRDCWTLLILSGAGFLGVAITLELTSAWWTPLTVPGFSKTHQELTVHLARVSLIGIVFTGMNSVQTALAFARHRYIRVDAIAALANVVAVGTLILFIPYYGVEAAVWIGTGRLCLQTVLLLPGMGRASLPDFRQPIIRLAWRRLKPLLIGASYYKMDPLVDRFLLSALPAGSLSLLYLAQQLYGAASQVLVKAVGVPVITQLSVLSKSDNEPAFYLVLRRTFIVMGGIGIAAVLALIVVGQPLLAAAIQFGRFGAKDSQTLWLLLVLTSGMFVAGSLGSLVSGAFYARGDTRTPTLLGSLSFTLAIGVKVLMFWLYGLVGVAIAISLYYLMSLVMLTVPLYRRGLNQRRVL
ncbi:virulence factor MviN [Sphingomonas sp. UV9]|uniref:lipid II flippase MurJ n=1 Tax=Sphingomonas sp. UV9 TaxID=1851410 RepID=UPI000FFCB4AE|nr:lipid II flippase MurJ [Sphingomonas sp. UV9]RXD02151.1 virulence factor MviN [Sphingomonas sp. UV9]